MAEPEQGMFTGDEDQQVAKARAFATAAHGDQKYGPHPYAVHLEEVAKVADRYWLPRYIRAAAWLHDTLEDTPTTYEDLVREFDKTIADVVRAVTDEPGKNRREHAATYPKTRSSSAAVALKLCDRIANVENTIKNDNDGLFSMYQKEHREFRAALFRKSEFDAMWSVLDSLLSAESVAEAKNAGGWAGLPLSTIKHGKANV